jgi:hypothetical protein
MIAILAATLISQFTGEALDEKGQFLFSEQYVVEKTDGKITRVQTIFKDEKDEEVAMLTSHFSTHPHLPNTSYKRAALSYGAKLVGPMVEVYNETKKSLKSKKTRFKPEMVAGHGFYFFILDHLESLIAGNEEKIDLLQPDKLTSYHFRARGTVDPKNEQHAVIKMEPKNPLIRALIPAMVFTIDRKEKCLVAYSGIDGFAMMVDKKTPISITYTQPEPI